MHMTADGFAYLVAEVCMEHLEYWDNRGIVILMFKIMGFKIQDSHKNSTS